MSILSDIKKSLSIPDSMTTYDSDILDITRSLISLSTQVSSLFPHGLVIDENTDWDVLPSDHRIQYYKTYITLRTRMIFDPPSTSFSQTAMTNIIKELEWRLSIVDESTVE